MPIAIGTRTTQSLRVFVRPTPPIRPD